MFTQGNIIILCCVYVCVNSATFDNNNYNGVYDEKLPPQSHVFFQQSFYDKPQALSAGSLNNAGYNKINDETMKQKPFINYADPYRYPPVKQKPPFIQSMMMNNYQQSLQPKPMEMQKYGFQQSIPKMPPNPAYSQMDHNRVNNQMSSSMMVGNSALNPMINNQNHMMNQNQMMDQNMYNNNKMIQSNLMQNPYIQQNPMHNQYFQQKPMHNQYIQQNPMQNQYMQQNPMQNQLIQQNMMNKPGPEMMHYPYKQGGMMQNSQDMFSGSSYDQFKYRNPAMHGQSMGGDGYNSEDKTKFLCMVLGICATAPQTQSQAEPLTTVYSWKLLDFAYENDSIRNSELNSGAYVPASPAPIDVDVYYGKDTNNTNRIFVTVPRFIKGIPCTLGVVSQLKRNGQNLIQPYPSWDWHRNPDACKKDRLVSVFRVKIDECGRLWVLDSGSNGQFGQTCQPQLVAFDLKTDKRIHSFDIPYSLFENRSVLVTPVIDVRGNCANTFVYIADCQAYSIIVYDMMRKVAWKSTDKTMYPYPSSGTYRIQGERFELMDGVLGMDITRYDPAYPNKDRILIFQALSSQTMNWVYTSNLRNQSKFISGDANPEIYHTFVKQRPSQSPAVALDKDGIAYFGLATETSVNCWNTNTEYGMRNIDTVYRNTMTMQFASGVKVITNSIGYQELWVVTPRFQKVATGTINPNEINFRISAGKISTLLDNTKCRSATSGSYGFKPQYG